MPASQTVPGLGDAPPQESGSHSEKREWIAVAAIVIVGLGLRLLCLDGQSFTMDEVTELQVAREPADLPELIKGARRFPPLYHLILRGWQMMLPGDLSARALSVVLGVLAIVVLYRLGRRLAGSRTAFWVAAFVAVSPFHIWYSQETRVYGLVFLISALTLLLLYRALESSSVWDWALFTLAATAGLFTHYYFPVLLVLTAGIAAWATRKDLASMRRALAAHTALSLAGIPWALLLLRDLQSAWGPSRFSEFGFSGFGYTYFSFVTGYTLGPSLRELHVLDVRTVVMSMLPWLVLIAVSVGVLAKSGFVALDRTKWRGSLIVLAVAPVVLVGLASEIGPFGYNVRHVAWAFIPVSVWFGAGLSRWRRSPAVVISGVILLTVSGVALWNRHFVDRYRNEDSAAVAKFLESSGDSAPVFVSAWYMVTPLDHYLTDSSRMTAIPAIRRGDGSVDQALATISSRLATEGHAWLAYSRPFHGDPEGVLLNEVSGSYAVTLAARFAGFELFLLESSP